MAKRFHPLWCVLAVVFLPLVLVPFVEAIHKAAPPIPASRFQDWSTRHAIYSRTGNAAALEAARRDPRALMRWRDAERSENIPRPLPAFAMRFRGWPRRFPNRTTPIQRDWNIYLGNAGTAPSMYPAKFNFDVNAAPNCTNDFVVFPVNSAGSGTQPNIVAFNNLYSGTSGGTGICNSRTAPPSGHTDTTTSATVLFSYNVSKIGGAVTTSPVISFDSTGSKIAFVESASGQPAHFHVLAWKSGDGRAASFQNALLPATISTFVNAPPVAGSGTATDLALGAVTTGSDTLSSPFIDYTDDVAYVGNDIGVIYRIKNVFCPSASCGGAAPTLDPTWGMSGALTIGGTCTGKLTGVVLSAASSNVYVGCADGKLYSISQAGVIKSLVIGDGTNKPPYGGIVDSVNGFVYAVTGSASNGANAALVQAKLDLSSPVSVPIGVAGQCNMHAPTPNNAYLTNIASAAALIYVGGLSTTGSVNQPCNGGSSGSAIPTLYGAGFNSTGVMKSGTPTNVEFDNFGGLGREFSPISEFFNSTTGTDWLFVSALQSMQVNFGGLNVTNSFFVAANIATEGVGTSGIIVDNNASTSAFPQAASVYFNALQENPTCTNNTNGAAAGGCAIKLTQSNLQ